MTFIRHKDKTTKKSGVPPSLVSFVYFLTFYPTNVLGVHRQFSSLLQVLGRGRGVGATVQWEGGQSLSSCRDHALDAGSRLLSPRQVRCGLQGQEVSKVLVPHHNPLAFPLHLSKHKDSNFQGVPCRLTGINVTLSFDCWQSHSQRIS